MMEDCKEWTMELQGELIFSLLEKSGKTNPAAAPYVQPSIPLPVIFDDIMPLSLKEYSIPKHPGA